jgi:hypothetical protein
MKCTVLRQQIEKADNAKKTNSLDLSSDQDLTIGLMNLLFIEDYISNPESNLSQMIAGVREKLMNRIVKKSDKNRQILEKLLLESMQLIDDGDKQSGVSAYQKYDDAYEKYSLFWGINMGLIDKKDIK